MFRKGRETFFGFYYTEPDTVSRDTIAIIGSLCISKSIHPALGQGRATQVLRKLSREFCTHGLHAKVLLEDYDIVDLGDFCNKKLTSVVTQVLRKGARVLVIGGDHTTTLYALRDINVANLTVFDAHLDSEECKEGVHHGCVIRKLIEEKDRLEVTLVGMRGYSTLKGEIEFLKQRSQRIFAWPVSEETVKLCFRESEYISIDLDFFNPSSFWAVRAPEPLGFDINHFISIINEVRKTNARYIDVVEYSPEADPGYVCGKLLLQLVLEILSTLTQN
ncbi:MAG: arginase family protein [Crenarchaeota archaeon]|nr:arginase family protein [Thermoproteota archaeon]MCR8454216.1 arginase family protein [Thermoproteota archaeon]MCR8454728.1 arginase family protein [Thermoproteota archaeon]MCR8463402.1 arginase family protein [Thermoproteota archaeon]MCR8470239.1 arginase family protein [Thermoproteota archaeon]